jgi:hypothetical protein
VIRAEAAADDVYAALDLAWAKLEARLRKLADRRRVHHGSRTPLSVSAATAATTSTGEAGDSAEALPGSPGGRTPSGAGGRGGSGTPGAPAAPEAASPSDSPSRGPNAAEMSDARIVPMDVDGEGPLVVREKVHKAEPMGLDQALLEMELVGHDFYLFVDVESHQPSVVYRRRGYDYGVIRLGS